MRRFPGMAWIHPAALTALLSCCANPMRHPEDQGGAADREAVEDAKDQGIAGHFEILAGARPADPGCGNRPSPAARDSCEREYRRGTRAPLRGSVLIVNAAGDSVAMKLDSLGGYRAIVPPGSYTVCAEPDRMPVPLPPQLRCQRGVEVRSGSFTPFSRSLPMP